MQGFSNTTNPHLHNHLSLDSSMPMPFKIPIVLQTFLNPEIELDFTNKQKDLVEALRFSMNAKNRLFSDLAVEEQTLIEKMTHEGEDTQGLKDSYSELQTKKLEASEICFDLINALADDLSADQYQKLLALSNISL